MTKLGSDPHRKPRNPRRKNDDVKDDAITTSYVDAKRQHHIATRCGKCSGKGCDDCSGMGFTVVVEPKRGK